MGPVSHPYLPPSDVRDAFRASAEWFVAVVDDVGSDGWERPALGEWNVRELVGHTSRNCLLITDYLDVGSTGQVVVGPFAFWNAVLSKERSAVHASIAEQAAEQALSLGPDVAASMRELIERTIQLVDRASDTAALRFGSAGTLALIDLLPSRVVEFVGHGLDICHAIGREHADLPPDTARFAAVLLASRGDPVAITQALLGRNGSPVNVFD
jgi:uncharacterized protein (TIGR03083 family)